MEVIHSISVPLFDYHYTTAFSTVKPRVLKVCEQTSHILLILFLPTKNAPNDARPGAVSVGISPFSGVLRRMGA
jgi:hypothetical protein